MKQAFQYGSEPVSIQRILIGFEAILENAYLNRVSIEIIQVITMTIIGSIHKPALLWHSIIKPDKFNLLR